MATFLLCTEERGNGFGKGVIEVEILKKANFTYEIGKLFERPL